MPIYVYSCEACKKEFERVERIENAGKPATCECGASARQVIAPGGYDPWKPFYCDTQSQNFETRESYRKYCRKKGLEGITAKEYRDISQEAKYLAQVEKEKRQEVRG